MAVTYRTKQIFCLIYCCVLFLSGLVIICTTTVVSYKMFIHSKFVPCDNLGPLGIFVVIGFFHLLLTWIALKGPSREHSFYITSLVVFSSILALISLGSFIWSVILMVNSDKKVEQIMTNSFVGYLELKVNEREWNFLEEWYKCCGIFDSLDYPEKNCTKSNLGCKEPFVNDLTILYFHILILGGFIFLQNVMGCFIYFIFRQALKEEKERRLRLKRERAMLARARRISQRS